ncbi:bifunctional PIG-L family deacetylase/class I SAM-dependent methyltransferase [Arthrobacter caoxuetaonis]|uniref:Bifunctional PIG-L family deacetylase/class I SAM-dependent methyltransferase n=1 Tax=Arthrobacter caoxuetaonis TaxID=2886935 RepID=A0A9X1SDA9_9MICC|nr:bifunctional PIG-L family deacetylase/class I SAM-dependent methyltransferase [Arthrobacter caoxuetaonis]MCC3298587.1 bifunctional PIG-L family deacetylase/class I SAM-dependent methyltransferase [Arthrobacter caoxuetaonis]USQ57328.1 bifunctional PIG-L family deacetylase/class I SAM-dependent methyltransferase [Arthrobacter caoxuetaonis]
MSFTHLDQTRSEPAWLEVLRDVQPLSGDLPGVPSRLVVLAAHPDDETLGAGGLIASLAAAGTAVDVVVATAGEGSHPNSKTYSPQALAALRNKELHDAVSRLAPAARVHLLPLPDGGLSAHRTELDRILAEVVGEDSDDLWLAAPWRGDGHTDHDTAGQAAAAFAAKARIPLLEYPIWLWHWGTPTDVPAELRVFPLGQDAAAAKRDAMAAHSSQVNPLSGLPGDEALLAPEVLAHFERPFESFAVTVPKSQSRVFEELYARSSDPWNFEGSFYEHRKRALTLAMLPRERFGRVFEPGCSIGVLTAELARRADSVIAMDVSQRALDLAGERLAAEPGVRLVRGSIPGDWPAGEFDLLVISEVGYFMSPSQLREVVSQAAGTLAEDGVLLLCHWRHPMADWPLGGDDIHEAFRDGSGLDIQAEHIEEDFRIDVLVHRPAVSPARREGLL